MNNTPKTRLTFLTILGGVIIAGMVSVNVLSTAAFADRQSDPNAFGKGASDLGKSGQMGEHASSQSEPRLGIGNVGQAICGEKLKPGDLAGVLNGGSCP